MCFELDSSPPIPPIAGAAVDARDVTLRPADGTPFAAFFAKASVPTGAAVVILPDVRGLYRFYEELALRFAEEGIDALAIDYFGRTAGVAKRDESFPFMEHIMQTKSAQIADDVRAAVEFLRSSDGADARHVFTVGFCFGGQQSWLQAANGHGLAGAIGFYGRPGPTRDGAPGPVDRAREFACPVLALMGGADQGIPLEQVEELRGAWEAAGILHEVVVYPGAPHSFFDRRYEEYAQESADAWRRCLEFIRRYAGVPASGQG